MQSLSIIGAGRLGKSLGRLAVASGAYRLDSVYCQTLAHAEQAVEFIGAGQPRVLAPGMLLSEVNLLSVPDSVLSAVADLCSQLRPSQPDWLVFHASGVHDHQVLMSLAARGYQTGSLHPVFSFAEPARAIGTFAGALCALEGQAAAIPALQAFALAIGARPFLLAAGSKAAYHAALSIASNFLVTLTGLAGSVAAQAGVDLPLVPVLLGSLMHQTLDNALALGPERALTGPIMRGDAETVALHLQALPQKEQQALYRALGRATVDLAASGLQPAQCAALRLLLAG